MTTVQSFYADYISYMGDTKLTLTDQWSAPFELDAIDSFSGRPALNDALVRFGIRTGGGALKFGPPITLTAGSWQGPDGNEYHNFQAMQFKNRTAGNTATLEVIAVCKG